MFNNTFMITDPSDWLTTNLPELSNVDAAFRCQVCKDFFITPMITGCSHTFCSSCIRRALSNDGKCPLCRSNEQEVKLRPNLSMEEAVLSFVSARPKILATATSNCDENIMVHTSSKRKGLPMATENTQLQLKRLRSSTTKQSAIGRKEESLRILDSTHVATSSVTTDSHNLSNKTNTSLEAAETSVFCPSCQCPMKQWQVFGHLDKCSGFLTPFEDTHIPSSLKSTRACPSHSNDSNSSSHLEYGRPVRLAAINYSLVKEQALRKRLSEIGVPSSGTKPVLERRHREWLTIWNANCDSTRPKTKSELLHQLDLWERAQSTRGASVAPGVEVRDKTFDTTAWSSKHGKLFKDLIAKAKSKRYPDNNSPPCPTSYNQNHSVDKLGACTIHNKMEALDAIDPPVKDGLLCEKCGSNEENSINAGGDASSSIKK